jgi:hypothetical protein
VQDELAVGRERRQKAGQERDDAIGGRQKAEERCWPLKMRRKRTISAGLTLTPNEGDRHLQRLRDNPRAHGGVGGWRL